MINLPIKRRGFTLMELLLVLGILGVLAAIVLVAINPTKQLSDARAVNRSASVREIENAIVQYLIDGNSLSGVPSTIANAKDICRSTATGSVCTNLPVDGYDLDVLTPGYLVSIPIDPDETGESISGYRIYQIGSFIKVCSKVEDSNCGS